MAGQMTAAEEAVRGALEARAIPARALAPPVRVGGELAATVLRKWLRIASHVLRGALALFTL